MFYEKEMNIKKLDIDFVIVISSDIVKLNKKYHLENINELKIPMYIITNNLATKNVVEAISISKYVSYTRCNIVILSNKIIRIHELNKENV